MIRSSQYRTAVLTLLGAVACQHEPAVHPQQSDLVVGVYASGTVVPENEFKLFSLAEGYLRQQQVQEDDTVRPGQVLFQLESTEQQSRLQLAKTQYEISRENFGEDSPFYKEQEAQIRSLKERLANDSVNLVRFRNLIANGVSTRSELERRELAFQTSRNEYRAARERLARTRTELRNQLSTAQAQLSINQAQQGYYALTSPIPARVFDVYKEPNEVVRRGEVVALLGDADHFYLRLSVDELDIARVEPGQVVLAEVDAFKGKPFKAKVKKVYPMIQNGEQTYRVDAEFEDTFPSRFVGMPVEANIIVAERKDVLTLPASYVFGNDSVRIRRDGKEQIVHFERGEGNFDLIEIKSGLTANDDLLKPAKKR